MHCPAWGIAARQCNQTMRRRIPFSCHHWLQGGQSPRPDLGGIHRISKASDTSATAARYLQSPRLDVKRSHWGFRRLPPGRLSQESRIPAQPPPLYIDSCRLLDNPGSYQGPLRFPGSNRIFCVRCVMLTLILHGCQVAAPPKRRGGGGGRHWTTVFGGFAFPKKC